LLGGSYLNQDETGASCTATAFTSDLNFTSQDLGFRCCFTADPTQ
jgi:hypothetical protein